MYHLQKFAKMTQQTKTYKYTNSGSEAVNNIIVNVPSESGYTFVSYSATSGSYNPENGVWNIPSVSGNSGETLTITYSVSAQTLCEENCTKEATANPVNINHGNTYTVKGIIPCSSLCTEGTTLIEITDQSENISVDIDASSGNYVVTILDITSDWHFEYTIKCIHCDEVTSAFGPARVEGKTPDTPLLPYFSGEIRMYGGTGDAPTGWAYCDGSVLNIEDEPLLYSRIGTTFGGDGVTTFALPDFRGRMPLGTGTGAGLTARTLADTGGAETHTLTEAQLPTHDHNVRVDSNTEIAISNEAGGRILGAGSNIYNNDSGEDAYLGGVLEDPVGSDEEFSLMNPFLAINFIIAVKGF